ncbi:uncharacterized protein JCM15063_004633 [Sporobolomyces koalae]|uniref:uncharacterized protein n=1 Tax=Sporobolomyces koalae TaxID=500713 RepID=UPI003178C376
MTCERRESRFEDYATFFAPSARTDSRIIDFGTPELEDEPGARFESPPDSTPSTPSFSFTSFDDDLSKSNSHLPASSPNPNVHAAIPTVARSHKTLPTIHPIPLRSSSPPRTKLPAYAAKSPVGLRVDSSPTSPLRALPPTNPLHAFVLRTIPHSLLPARLTRPRTFQYPKSPSLMRAHPSTRHPASTSITSQQYSRQQSSFSLSRRSVPKRWIVLLVFLAFVVGSYSTLVSLTSTTSSSWLERAKSSSGWDHFVYRGAGGRNKTIAEHSKVTYVDTAEIVRGKQRLDVTGELPKLGSDHSSLPATVVSTEEAEEQAVLDAVVEEAKQVIEAESEGVDRTGKETIPKALVVKEQTKPAVKPRKDPSRYKRLLPLKGPSRRYLYGANFIASAESAQAAREGTVEVVEVEDSDYTNKKVKVPSKKALERLFRENKKAYEDQIPSWRDFEWQAPKADHSLDEFVAHLNPEELALRTWIQQLHTLPIASGVGLGAISPALSFNPPSISAISSSLPAAPRFSGIGDRDKYDQLITQATEGYEGKCKSSTWLSGYQKMHGEMLDGSREPKFISYHCEKGMNCGGLGDRLLGMTSAFFFGLVTQRSFLAEWQSPIPLDIVFDSPAVNWSYSSFTSSQHPVLGQESLVDQSAELDIIHFDRLSVDSTFGSTSWNPKKGKQWTKGFEKRDIAYASKWIKFFTNRGMIFRSFQYKHLQKSIKRLGLEPTTAFSCINQYLFRPKPPARNLISEYTSVLSLPSVFSVGIHVRTGDRSMKDSEYDKVNTVKRHSQFFRCARELGETYASSSQRIVYYLVTDSANLKQDARRVLGSKLVTTDTVPQHVHQKQGHVDGVFSAVVEDWILAKTDMMVATQDSGFGKLASFMHAKENTTVTIFPRHNEDVNGLQSKKSHLKVDCTSPDVFTSFEELSSEWSLG